MIKIKNEGLFGLSKDPYLDWLDKVSSNKKSQRTDARVPVIQKVSTDTNGRAWYNAFQFIDAQYNNIPHRKEQIKAIKKDTSKIDNTIIGWTDIVNKLEKTKQNLEKASDLSSTLKEKYIDRTEKTLQSYNSLISELKQEKERKKEIQKIQNQIQKIQNYQAFLFDKIKEMHLKGYESKMLLQMLNPELYKNLATEELNMNSGSYIKATIGKEKNINGLNKLNEILDNFERNRNSVQSQNNVSFAVVPDGKKDNKKDVSNAHLKDIDEDENGFDDFSDTKSLNNYTDFSAALKKTGQNDAPKKKRMKSNRCPNCGAIFSKQDWLNDDETIDCPACGDWFYKEDLMEFYKRNSKGKKLY